MKAAQQQLPLTRPRRSTGAPTCHILVPADFSTASEAALEYAASLAWRVTANIDLLHVWSLPPVSAAGTDARRVPLVTWTRKMARLRAMAAAHCKTGVSVRGRLELGDLAGTIARVAAVDRFDLVVLGVGDGSLASRSLAASVAYSVRCPVISLRAVQERYEPLELALHEAAPEEEATHHAYAVG